MSRVTDGSTQWWRATGSAAVAGQKFFICGWAKPPAADGLIEGEKGLFWLGQAASAATYLGLGFDYTATSIVPFAVHRRTGYTTTYIQDPATVADGDAWNFIGLLFDPTTGAMKIYCNYQTVSGTTTNPDFFDLADRMSFGRFDDASPDRYAGAFFANWSVFSDVEPTADDIGQLLTGVDAWEYWPANCVGAWNFKGADDPVPDLGPQTTLRDMAAQSTSSSNLPIPSSDDNPDTNNQSYDDDVM